MPMSPLARLTGAVVLAASCAALNSAACAADEAAVLQPERLVGLWGVEQVLAPAVRGELTIDARGAAWEARIAGYRAPVTLEHDRVAFSLPGGHGEFRGRRSGRRIVGHWIQPATIYPYSARYASPVSLAPAGAGVFKGEVSPLESRVSLYIQIESDGRGGLRAFIRNPEANLFAGRDYAVRINGNHIDFAHAEVPEEGVYDPGADTILSPLLYRYPALTLTRRSSADAVGFYPGARRSEQAYSYRPPFDEDDGWEVASLSDADIDVAAMERLVQRILSSRPSPDNPLNIHSLQIARRGRLVLDEYFYGFDAERPHDMRSASKTIAPILVGVASDRREPIDADTRVYDLFPELIGAGAWDEAKRNIRLVDFMNMASGLAIDDADSASPGQEGRTFAQTDPDMCRYTLMLPLVRPPGGPPIYGSANTNVVGCALSRATHQWLPDLFQSYLAGPLEIRDYHMNLMANGEGYAGGGLYLRPRDQLKFGQLYLSGGVWNGRRVVSHAWVERSTVRHGDMRPRIPTDLNHGYGYGWHFRSATVAGRVIEYYWAGGNGGQYVIVAPELDLVVGFTGGDISQPAKYLPWEINLLPEAIFAAVH